MIDKYFYFILDEQHKILETAISVEHPGNTTEHEGKISMIVFDLNVLTPKQIPEYIDKIDFLNPKQHQSLKTITKLFFNE